MPAEITEPAWPDVPPVCGAAVAGPALRLSLAAVLGIAVLEIVGFGPPGRAALIVGQLLGGRCLGRVVRP
jgi:hypothetical protein